MNRRLFFRAHGCAAAALFAAVACHAVADGARAEPASAQTAAANAAVLQDLSFSDRQDFENAARGLLRKPDTLTIKDASGKTVWDLESYKAFIALDRPAPDSVNPSLWRNAQLNLQYGLFQVTDRIYQVRGYDLANFTFIRGDTGWIAYDVGSTSETARAAFALLTEEFGELPIVAAIYSHPHLDHYGGIRGLVSDEDVRSSKVKLIAPEGFMEHAVSENVITGNAMSRRSILMYGALLPRGPEGSVGAGLGLTTPRGTPTLIEPNQYITRSGEKLTIDGVEMEFQLTPGTEAHAEMNTYFPQFRAMWMAENTTSTMHNILTLRGAQVRDALAWARYINETLELYGDRIDVKFQSHHWPLWGMQEVDEYLRKQRDLYKFIHDRTVNLINQGYTGEEISEMIKLPASLEGFWSGRGYYGTLRHNSRAVYQRYMGWYDGNPSSLNNLPPEEVAPLYVSAMGGADAILAKAERDYADGKYRWVAEMLKHVVFADPSNAAAKELLAKAYEQMGYQAESGPWRSIYLQGAFELRNGAPKIGSAGSASPDVVRAMSPEMLFDFLAVRLDADKAAGKDLTLNVDFTDIGKHYTLTVGNSVLNYSEKQAPAADATATLSKETLDELNLGTATVPELIASGKIQIDGDGNAFQQFFDMLDTFSPDFNVVTP